MFKTTLMMISILFQTIFNPECEHHWFPACWPNFPCGSTLPQEIPKQVTLIWSFIIILLKLPCLFVRFPRFFLHLMPVSLTHLTNTIVHSDDGQVKRSRTPTVLLQCSHLWRCASSVKSSQRPCQHGGDDGWCKIQSLDGHACRTCSFSLLIATQCQRRGWEAGLQTFPHRSLFALPLFRWQDGNRVRQYLSEVKLNSPRINLTCTHRWSWWGSLGRSSWTCWVFGQASIWISLRK